MTDRWLVRADHVWKRYCRTMRRSVRYALTDGVRSFVGLPPTSGELREDEFWSLRDISFELHRGEAMAVIGANGAGKSTLLKILSGVIAPDRGELRVRGRIVSMMMAGVGFHPVLTGRENIYIYGSLLGLRRREIQRRIPAILEFADLTEFLDTPVKYYSTGMYMRLAFSIAAQTLPDVFVIDEVLAVGDITFRTKCIDHLQTMKREGCALLLVSHSSGHLRALADHGLWLRRGECQARGPIESVLDLYLDEQGADAPPGPASPPAAPPIAGDAPPPAGATPGGGAAPDAAAPKPWTEIDLTHPAPEHPITLSAHADNRVSLRLRASERSLEPVVTVAFEVGGAAVAGAALTLAMATFPQVQAERALKVDFDLRPHLAAADGELVVRLSRFGDDGAEHVLASRRWPCRIAGRPDGAGPLDLQEEFAWRPAPPRAVPAPESVVDPGGEVAVLLPEVVEPRAWLLLDGQERPVARVPLPTPVAGAPVLVGTFRAHLPGGDYVQALETGAGLVRGPGFQVRDRAEPVGHADLQARCHVGGVRADDAAAATAGCPIRCTHVELDGSTPSLDALLGATRRLATQPRRSAQTTTALASGERCRLRLGLHAAGSFTDWDVTVAFGHPERGRCAGMRLRRHTILGGAGAFDLCFEFAAHLARGEYLIGCSAIARDPDGRQVELHVPDFARCFVLGPRDTGSDGSLELLSLQTEERPAVAAPAPRAEAADLDGSGLRLLEFALDGHSGAERTILPAGRAATVAIGVLAATAVDEPSFKFAFVNPSQRCVARMIGFEDLHPLAPLPAGAARTYRMHFAPHLAGGRYEVQVALVRRARGDATVTDRRHLGAVCLVPARARPTGPGLIEASAVVDLE